MPSIGRIVLACVLPVSLFLGAVIPAARPLDRIFLPLQAFFLGLFVYHLCLVLFGLQATPPRVPPGRARHRFAVLIPAHNEEAVIGPLLTSLRAQDYPQDHFRTYVVADHCADATAEAARRGGAVAFSRDDGVRGGKGAALAWLLERVEAPGEAYDAIVIVDADNVVAPEFLRMMDARLERGEQVIQGYLGTKNPDDSWITRAIYASYAYTNRFFQLAKTHLGLSSSLGGTGLCVALPALHRLGWPRGGLTEDLEFQIRAVLGGTRPTWAWDAVVYDEKPLGFQVAFQQRRRWMQGHASVAVRYLGALLRRAVLERDLVAWDAVIYLGAPLWLTGAFLLTLAHLTNLVVPSFSYLYPPWLPLLLLVVSLSYPYAALRLEGLPTSVYRRTSTLLAVLLLGVSWPLLGLLGMLHHRGRHWVKTTHVRAFTIADAGQNRRVSTAPIWSHTGAVRALAAVLIAAAAVATITPHLTARRLWPPLEEGGLLLLQRRPQEALRTFEEAAELRPDDAVVHAFLAITYRILGNNLAAAGAFARARRLDPEMENTMVAVVDFFLRHRDHPQASVLLQEMVRGTRSGAEAFAWVANHFIDRGRTVDAGVIVREGLRRYGLHVALLRVQGYLFLVQRRPADAVLILQLAHGKAPRDSGIMVNLGWAHVRLRQYAQAVQVWEQALRLDPRNEALRHDLEEVRRLVRQDRPTPVYRAEAGKPAKGAPTQPRMAKAASLV